MDGFFSFFETNRLGILVFFLFLAGLAILTQWIVWIFGKGRFQRATTNESNLRYVIAQFFIKVIDQFRHLLALIVVLIFAIALGYAMVQSQQGTLPTGATRMAELKESLAAIMSTLGGFVGLIIGYYFGESTVIQSDGEDPEGQADAEPLVQNTAAAVAVMEEAPQPPIADINDDEGEGEPL